ncbi:hypothetical protein FRC01_010388, partial [Tulasnella sp. 417]
EPPPLSAWTTMAHTLRGVERPKIAVNDSYLRIQPMGGPYHAELFLDTSEARYEDTGNVVYSLLKDILDEAEKDAHIPARVELSLFTSTAYGWSSDFDLALEVLKLLQTPVCDFSSGLPRWRIPNLDTISMPDPGLPYHHLRAFVQARSNGSTCIHPSSPITGIFTRTHAFDEEYREEVLNKVMAYAVTGMDG